MSSEPDRGRDGGAAELLRARGVSKRFAGVTALDGVDFDLRAGEVHALVGENGAGKSTLMKILSGVHTDYDGEVRIGGEPVRFASVRDAERAGVAIIHQELNLVPELGVAANIFLGREPLIAGLILDRRAMVAAGAAACSTGSGSSSTRRRGSRACASASSSSSRSPRRCRSRRAS